MKLKHTILALLLTLPVQNASADFIVDVYAGLGPFNDIAAAITAMNGTTATSSGSYDVINFSDGGNLGNFGGDNAFPGSPGNLFGVHVTGNIFVPSGITYYGINHDDGARLYIAGLQIINWAAPTPPRNDFGGIGNGGPGVVVPIDLWLYENSGVASLEFFYSSNGAGNVGRLVRTVPEPGTLALLGLGLFGLGMARRRKMA